MTSKKTGSRSSPSSTRRKPRRGSKKSEKEARRVPVADLKDDFSRYLRLAEKEEVLITRHGRPAGVLIGFESEDDWFEYRLEQDPSFLTQISEARAALRRGEGVRLEDIEAGAV
jgi:prevent-host-death family protein